MTAARTPLLLDARGLQPGFKAHRGRGIGTYVASLVRALADRPEAAGLGLLIDPALPPPDDDERAGFALVPLRGRAGPARLYQPLRTELLFRGALDGAGAGTPLVHFPSHLDAPVVTTLPFTVTVHDLIPRLLPEPLPAVRAAAARLRDVREARAVRRARAILVDSDSVRADVERFFPEAAGKMTVVPLGVDARFFARVPQARIDAVRARLGLEGAYVLHVGGIDRSKNVPFLLSALEAWRARRPDAAGQPPVLALCGAVEGHRAWPVLAREIAELGLADAVRLLGFVPAEDMAALYQGALCLASPSLYEGFGLPALEAMAGGTPALVSARGAPQEIAGPGGITLDPHNGAAWADAFAALESDAALRLHVVTRGTAWVARYSWDATARATFAALERAARRNAPA